MKLKQKKQIVRMLNGCGLVFLIAAVVFPAGDVRNGAMTVAVVCGLCGLLISRRLRCPHCGERVRLFGNLCPHCGKEIDP